MVNTAKEQDVRIDKLVARREKQEEEIRLREEEAKEVERRKNMDDFDEFLKNL
jgi:hypothetical protein